MAHGIMICDVPLYRDLTKVNVHAYLASKLVWVDSLEKFELLISLDQTYEFIITLSVLGKADITERVIGLREKYIPRAPLIVIGHHDSKQTNIGSIQSPYDQKAIIKYIVTELKWTTTEYNSRNVDDYIPIPLTLIKYSTHAIEDLYLIKPDNKLNEYVLAASKGEDLTDLMKNWVKLEIVNLFVSKDKRLAAAAEITKHTIAATENAIASKDNSVMAKAHIQNAEFFADILNDPKQFGLLPLEAKQEISVLAQKTNGLIATMLNSVANSPNPTLSALLNAFKSQDQSYIPQFSFLSTYVCLQMIRKESWFNAAVEEKVRYIHFFNNLALVTLYKKYPAFPKEKNIYQHNANFGEREKEIYRWHARVSSNLISNIPGLPVGVDQIVLQHHGNIFGDYQNTNLHEDLSLLAKYCFISELFTEYFLDANLPANKINKAEIIQKVREKITFRSYLKIINTLENIVI